MVAKVPDRWAELQHAYGSAQDIPALLERARSDVRPWGDSGTTGFKLWSALCHQGDTCTAGYAALPHLFEIAKLPQYQGSHEPLLLAGCIELARLEGRGPEMPIDLSGIYDSARIEGAELARRKLASAADDDSKMAFSGSLAALLGDAAGADRILNSDQYE